LTSLIFIFLSTGLISGFIAGLLGVGGGIIIIPITYFVLINLGYSNDIVMHVSIASSLGIICFTSISSIRSHLKLGNVNIEIVKKWIFGIIAGSLIGSLLASNISGEILLIIFVSLALIISINMILQQEPILIIKDIPKSKSINFIISFLIGFLSVLIGIGGGSFSVPTLSMFSRKIHEAVGTSAALGFLIAFPGTIIFMITGSFNENTPDYSIGYLNIIIVILVSSTSVFTANIGAKISSKINKITLKRIFAIFLLFTCASLIIEHFII
tara:strand:+ start:434 stop:1243 length:810 start_codon:yes stop_codon:yes gene_type:complete